MSSLRRRIVGGLVAGALLLLGLLVMALFGLRGDWPGARRGQRPGPARSVPLAIHVYADTGRGGRLELPIRRRARVWLAHVSPTRLPPPSPALPRLVPEDLPAIQESPPPLEVDTGLKPPVLRRPGVLALPSGGNGGRGSVELDVRVDESGRVSDAVWAGGSADTALVSAARRCALGMYFYPALRAGRPVAVWCRQRFEVGEDRR